MRRYESPAENWPRAFRIVQTYSSEYYFLFKYIRIPIFQIKLKILSLSPLIKDQRSSQQFVSYWRNFHSNLNERLILLNYTACWNIEKRKKERKKVIPKHFSKCSLLSPFPSLVDDVFGQPRVIFARRDGCSNRAHRSRQILSRSLREERRQFDGHASPRIPGRQKFISFPRSHWTASHPATGRGEDRVPAIMGSARSVLDFQEIPKWYYAIPYGTRTPSKRAILVHLAETARLLLSNEFLDLCFSVLAIYRARVWCSLTGGSRPLERRSVRFGKRGMGRRWSGERRDVSTRNILSTFHLWSTNREYTCVYIGCWNVGR